MNSQDSAAVELVVRGAEKRDAGRGVARIPEAARRKLGVLSGDTVVVRGERTTVAKVWPADGDVAADAILVDADTRANAGVQIGDSVVVAKRAVEDATSVTVAPPPSLDDVDAAVVERAVTSDLHDRPVSEGEQVRLERVADAPFRVVDTDPDGPVRVTTTTTVFTAPDSYEPDDSGVPADARDDGEAVVTYEDIGGLDEELELVREMIEIPLSEPELFRELGVDAPKGVLLYGPPGTGKTLIAKAVSNEVDAEFVTVHGPEIMSKYKGESEERLREAFDRAAENAPAVVFFDEIDSIAGDRDDSDGAENRVVAQLLSLMDGLDSREDVVVIGATNRPDAIDPALRRGGRFDREIGIGVPDEVGRREILQVQTRGMPLSDDVSLETLAARTHGFVGADLHALVTEAAMHALPRFREADDDEPREVTRADFDSALAAVEPSAMREYVAETPSTSFDDVGGLQDAKDTLTEAVEWPLAYDRLFEVTNTDPPSGVLLHGPPGTGKTLLARALAGETDVNFVHVNGPEIIDKYVGESEKAVREVFDRARQAAPSIVFFDEIDAVTARRGEGHEVTERVVSQLLTELDGLAENPNVVVLAATNRRDAIDPAILRPGRIDTHVEVPEPDEAARRKILAVHARGKPLADEVDLDALAAELAGYTGADLEAVVRDATMRAIRELADELGPEEANERAEEVEVTPAHFDAAVAAVDPSGR
ncbi:AAA family ATPase [Halostella salina]|uniref:AAA family ATPase n=1 Tax=Halostella salina TaxID=1547897 RepID=UPI000EF7D4A0|nr:AAA family ATPase [Halostella salina]